MITLETNRFREDCLRSFLIENDLSDRVKILNKNFHELNFNDLSEVGMPVLFNSKLYFFGNMKLSSSVFDQIHHFC